MSSTSLADAYHRAGHAVIALDLGVSFRQLVVGPPAQPPAECPFSPRGIRPASTAAGHQRAQLIAHLGARIVVAHAGPMAEEKVTGHRDAERLACDLATVQGHLAEMIGFAADTGELDDALRARARALVEDPLVWSRIELVAELLGPQGRATRAALIAAAPRPPRTRFRRWGTATAATPGQRLDIRPGSAT